MLGHSSWELFKAELDLKPTCLLNHNLNLAISSIPLLTSTEHLHSNKMQAPRRITKSDIDAFAPPAHQKDMMKVSGLSWSIVQSCTNEKRRMLNMLHSVSRLQFFQAVFVKVI